MDYSHNKERSIQYLGNEGLKCKHYQTEMTINILLYHSAIYRARTVVYRIHVQG